MSESRVFFDSVWKKFTRGERADSLRDLVPSLVRRALGRRPREADLGDQQFWAVRDVSFEVREGEALGIIGPNGAGKSTTLKLLTRILKPTVGRCGTRGRVGALIEVAAGFHPDLTGRENVYLQGAILGMRRGDISRRLDEIVEFAGVSESLDTPVKRYSSGMSARLGFSIAAHLEPDVLIIDEVLSVGDMNFQQRCLDRMTEFRERGTTIVFVSHNLQAVAAHCTRGLVMDHGEAVFKGPAHEAVASYVARLEAPRAERRVEHLPAWIESAQLVDTKGLPVRTVNTGDEVRLRVVYQVAAHEPRSLIFGIYVTDTATGVRLYNANARDLGLNADWDNLRGRVAIEYQFKAHLLRGAYNVNCHVSDTLKHACLDRLEPAGHLVVEEHFSVQGTTDLDVRCAIVEATPPLVTA